METGQLVHLVDDSAAMRSLAADILSGAGFTVREHPAADSLLGDPALAEAGCVVTDFRMPRIDGLDLLSRLRAGGSLVPVILLTAHADVSTAVRAMKLGAFDFIEKPFAPRALVQAVRSAVRGSRSASPDVRHALASERLSRLTERERQVLARILLGLTHREIGDDLAISHRTVEVFRARIMAKTECASVQDLVRIALEAGFD
ncbi:response regulator [Methylobacterium sp. 17Sr1-1]|uniref:response regulator transcription factor n=1 Tax=Methylobacterium sp. 17Sr1-1 TaxID=2202826 RepID=UPI000D6F6D30|nr:response regulator [Methylobacterium sp. 17Sr1-1]AWN53221.1 DNA-binding response regulator [Methylobacterium sp. 17Sr1-1]